MSCEIVVCIHVVTAKAKGERCPFNQAKTGK